MKVDILTQWWTSSYFWTRVLLTLLLARNRVITDQIRFWLESEVAVYCTKLYINRSNFNILCRKLREYFLVLKPATALTSALQVCLWKYYFIIITTGHLCKMIYRHYSVLPPRSHTCVPDCLCTIATHVYRQYYWVLVSRAYNYTNVYRNGTCLLLYTGFSQWLSW